MQRPSHFPNIDRISVLTVMTLLAFTMTRFINLSPIEFILRISWVYLSIRFDVRTLVAIFVAGLAATGANWLVRDHPAYRGQGTLQHWWLPAMTAWAIGVLLSDLPRTPLWWLGLLTGGVVLMLVLVAEYIAVDPEDVFHPLAVAGLTAVAYALFLALTIAWHERGSRLYILVPSLFIATGLVALRVLHLRLRGQWAFLQAVTVAIVCGQLATALHYWPLTPLRFGLLILGTVYALINLTANLAEGPLTRLTVLEPALILVLLWFSALWVS